MAPCCQNIVTPKMIKAGQVNIGDKINLERFMIGCSILCMISYILIGAVPVAAFGIIGCIICGFSVGIMWPGSFSIASASMRRGGTAMFALLALAGDLGCSSGPTFVGFISSNMNDNLKVGILAALIFPIFLVVGIQMVKKFRTK